jgi:hypothetical protein
MEPPSYFNQLLEGLDPCQVSLRFRWEGDYHQLADRALDAKQAQQPEAWWFHDNQSNASLYRVHTDRIASWNHYCIFL